MDALAIRPVLLDMCRRIAAHGYFVLLPDMFYRFGFYEPRDAAEIFATGDVVAALGPLMASTSEAKAASDCRAFFEFLDANGQVADGRYGVTGYCMGGATALIAAGLFPDHVAAAASFHAGFLVTDSALSPHRVIAGASARLFIASATDDPHFTAGEADTLRSALDAGGVAYDLETYEGARHGWTMADLPVYSSDAAERHWCDLLALLDAEIGVAAEA